LLEPLDDRTLLSTFVVSNLGDQGPGTLRDAIDQANLHPGSTIKFGVEGHIILSRPLPDLSTDVTINGPGVLGLTVEPNTNVGTPLFSIFTVDAGVTASISGLTIAGGTAVYGGGIFNAGTLTVTQCTLVGNSATHGGGIFNTGTLVVSDSTLTGDSATHINGDAAAKADHDAEVAIGEVAGYELALATVANAAPGSAAVSQYAQAVAKAGATPAIYAGGAIANFGTLAVSNGRFLGNSAFNGGAIANYATSTVGNTILAANSAHFGGGIGNAGSGTLTVLSGAFSNNSATDGGGIVSLGTLKVTGSIFLNNSVIGLGGGAIDNFGTSTVTSSVFSGNSASQESTSGSGAGLVINPSTTVVPQSIASSASVSLSATSTAAAPAGTPTASSVTAAVPSGTGGMLITLSVPYAETEARSSDVVSAAVDTTRTMPASAALSAAIVALDSPSGVSDARLVPLRESTLALVGTLLDLTLETGSNQNTQRSSALETNAALLVGPGSTIAMSRSLPPSARQGRAGGGDARTGVESGAGVNAVPHRATSWEHYVIGLDRDFDRFRRTFQEPPGDEVEPTRANQEAPPPIDHHRATDEILACVWSEDTTSSLPMQSGSGTMASPGSSDMLREISAPPGSFSPGHESLIPPADPEELGPLHVSLSGVVLALSAGFAWMRLRVLEDARHQGAKMLLAHGGEPVRARGLSS
jgi:hypothetical protein